MASASTRKTLVAILNDEGFAVEAASTAAQGLTRAMGAAVG
jgi:hypothetical protein